MSSLVTPEMRQMGWNIHFLDATGQRFAGVYQRGELSTADVWRELQLCFDFSDAPENDGPWQPALLSDTLHDDGPQLGAPHLIHLDQNVQPLATPALDGLDSYHVIYHGPARCQVTVAGHHQLTAPCIWPVPTPTRRRDPRYLSPYKAPDDPRGAVSIPIPESAIPVDEARQEIAKFRERCMTGAVACVLTGLGKSWFGNPAIGPAMQVAHIVPLLHYHVYPRGMDQQVPDPNNLSQLRAAWFSTWSISNGIILSSHLHQLFDARLVSIHPRTLRIRAFVPYDMITPYHHRLAALDKKNLPDRNALQHHWDMCCIENMAAAMSTRIPSLGANQVVLTQNQQLLLNSGSIGNPPGSSPGPGPGPGNSAGRGGGGGKDSGNTRKQSTQAADHTQAPTPPVSKSGAANNIAGKGGTDKSIISISNNEVDEEEYLRGQPRKRQRYTTTQV